MHTIKALIGTMRVPFLVLAPACVGVGVATACWQVHALNWLQVIIVFIGGLSAHICVNVFNEYFDFKSGLDATTQRTPFSGGSGTLPAQPAMERNILLLAIASLLITASVGVYFVWLRGWMLLPLGIFGLVLLVTYTIWWVNNPLACLMAPGLGFGVLMVMGTHFSLTGFYSWTAFTASLVPTFLVSNLLLLNQFPDVEADKNTGRRHFPITIGRKNSSNLYGTFLLMTYVSIAGGVLLGVLPIFCLLALLTAPIAWKSYTGAYKHADDVPSLIPSMGMNVVINLATPVLLAIGLFIG
ncbi:MAG: prenyltransferase [Elusimicrobia bacterium]|nr:prenyltransferase [Elusimicrobiota bacterium]